MAERITAVDADRARKRHVSAAAHRGAAYLRATAERGRSRPASGDAKRRSSRASSSRRRTTSSRDRPSKQLVAKQLEAFCRELVEGRPAYARSKNLTPYDVLIIASMVEKEVAAPRGAAARRGGDLQPAARRMPLGIDATLRYGARHPADRVDPRVAARTPTRRTTRASSAGCRRRRSRTRASRRSQAAAHPAKVDYLYFVRKPDKPHHFFTASATRSTSTRARRLTDC